MCLSSSTGFIVRLRTVDPSWEATLIGCFAVWLRLDDASDLNNGKAQGLDLPKKSITVYRFASDTAGLSHTGLSTPDFQLDTQRSQR
jgi:hypothetical protein